MGEYTSFTMYNRLCTGYEIIYGTIVILAYGIKKNHSFEWFYIRLLNKQDFLVVAAYR